MEINGTECRLGAWNAGQKAENGSNLRDKHSAAFEASEKHSFFLTHLRQHEKNHVEFLEKRWWYVTEKTVNKQPQYLECTRNAREMRRSRLLWLRSTIRWTLTMCIQCVCGIYGRFLLPFVVESLFGSGRRASHVQFRGMRNISWVRGRWNCQHMRGRAMCVNRTTTTTTTIMAAFRPCLPVSIHGNGYEVYEVNGSKASKQDSTQIFAMASCLQFFFVRDQSRFLSSSVIFCSLLISLSLSLFFSLPLFLSLSLFVTGQKCNQMFYPSRTKSPLRRTMSHLAILLYFSLFLLLLPSTCRRST